MAEGTPSVGRPQAMDCDACGSSVRPWTLTPGSAGQLLCPECKRREVTSRRNRWIAIAGVGFAVLLVVVLGVALRMNYLRGPEVDMRALNESIKVGDHATAERYYDAAGIEASFKPLETKYDSADVFMAMQMSKLALGNISIESIDGKAAVGTAIWGQTNLNATIGSGTIRYVVVEKAPGEWKVASVSNADQLVAEYVKYMSQFGSF